MSREGSHRQHRWMIVAGGLSFVVAAVTFVSVFTYLAANFDYPAILDGSASEVLPRLLAGGTLMRATWALYAFLPLLLVPGAVGTYLACPASRGRMTLALLAAVLAAMAMCLGLIRWPSIHWALAEAYSQSGQEVRSSLAAVFTGLNLYLGNYTCDVFPLVRPVAFGRKPVCALAWLVRNGVRFSIPGRRVPQRFSTGSARRRYQQCTAATLAAGTRDIFGLVFKGR